MHYCVKTYSSPNVGDDNLIDVLKELVVAKNKEKYATPKRFLIIHNATSSTTKITKRARSIGFQSTTRPMTI
jgi:hypothetical protein